MPNEDGSVQRGVQRRDLQLHSRSANACSRPGTGSARTPTPRSSSISTKSKGDALRRRARRDVRDRDLGRAAAPAACWRATAPARSRCSSIATAAAWRSPPRSRRSSRIPTSASSIERRDRCRTISSTVTCPEPATVLPRRHAGRAGHRRHDRRRRRRARSGSTGGCDIRRRRSRTARSTDRSARRAASARS